MHENSSHYRKKDCDPMLQPRLERRSILSQVTVAARRRLLRLLEQKSIHEAVFANSAARITMRDPPSKMWFVLCSHSIRKGCVGFGRRLNSCCPVCDPRIVALAFSASLIRITAWCRRLSKSPSHFVNHALRRSHNIEGDSPIGPSKVAK